MSRRKLRTLLIVVGVLASAFAFRFGDEVGAAWDRFWAIDACLDHGGSWDYQARRCDRE
jgi:hypothetical protein